MEAASQAVDKLFSSLGNKTETTTDTSSATHPNEPGTVTADSKVEPALEDPALADKSVTKDEKVNPAVEHETVKKEHERQEETVVDKERHQHHYHTTVQPLEDKEVLPTQVNQETAATEVREVDHDDGKNVKADVDARNAEFESTKEVEESEKVTKTETEGGEQVHHHLHETIQPVIEKETVQPSVTKVTKPVTEIHQDPTLDHGSTTKAPKSVDEFKANLDGEERHEESLKSTGEGVL